MDVSSQAPTESIHQWRKSGKKKNKNLKENFAGLTNDEIADIVTESPSEKFSETAVEKASRLEDEDMQKAERVTVQLGKISETPLTNKQAETYFGIPAVESITGFTKYPSLFGAYPNAGFFNVFYACHQSPLQIWDKKVHTAALRFHIGFALFVIRPRVTL